MHRRVITLVITALLVLVPASMAIADPDPGVNCTALGCPGSPPDPVDGCAVGPTVNPCGSVPVTSPSTPTPAPIESRIPIDAPDPVVLAPLFTG